MIPQIFVELDSCRPSTTKISEAMDIFLRGEGFGMLFHFMAVLALGYIFYEFM